MNDELDKLLIEEKKAAGQVHSAEIKLEEGWTKFKDYLTSVTLEIYHYRWRLADIRREIKRVKGEQP